MPRTVVLHTRIDPGSAKLVRTLAERDQTTTSDWIAAILRRELVRAGDADALALRDYELLLTLGYMLRALMIESMGSEAAETAIRDAAATAADEAPADLRKAQEIH
jgi:hypothetical protein